MTAYGMWNLVDRRLLFATGAGAGSPEAPPRSAANSISCLSRTPFCEANVCPSLSMWANSLWYCSKAVCRKQS